MMKPLTLALLVSLVFGTLDASTLSSKTQPSRLVHAAPVTKENAASTCIPIDLGELKSDCVSCKVTGIKELGEVEGVHFAVAVYDYSWDPKTGLKNCGYGSMLFEYSSGSTQFRPLWGGFSDLSPEDGGTKPIKMFHKDFGTLIQIPVRSQGTGHFENDGVLLWAKGQLREINTRDYQADLASKLPAGLGMNKGLYPDYGKMTVQSGLWKKDDPNCCPSGGTVTAELDLKNDQIVVKSFHVK